MHTEIWNNIATNIDYTIPYIHLPGPWNRCVGVFFNVSKRFSLEIFRGKVVSKSQVLVMVHGFC